MIKMPGMTVYHSWLSGFMKLFSALMLLYLIVRMQARMDLTPL
jgi:hypothetical protein